MKFPKKHIYLALLLLLTASQMAGQDMSDSIRVEDLLVMDTIDLEILGPSNDVSFYLNGLVFLSNTKYHQNMVPDHITFGQIASYFVPLEYIALESSRPLFRNDPFPYSPAGTCYSRDYQTVYFTRSTEIPGNMFPEKVFRADIINGEVGTFKQISFTAGTDRYLHPAVSVDGSFMILASDASPSRGGLDLFISRKSDLGWTTPQNLGNDINTGGHDWFPFLDQHNNLFFSSSGHMGYGGYDIYVSYFNGEGWDKPLNLTDLINGPSDELGFSIHPGRKMALFSTNGEEPGTRNEVLKLELNKSAFVLAGIDTKNQDMSLLLKDLIRTGYTSATFGAASELEIEAGHSLTALPLLTEEEPESESQTEPEPEPEPEPVILLEEPEPEPEQVVPLIIAPVVAEELAEPEPAPEPEPEPEPEPAVAADVITFRVQILSNSRPNSQPSVSISGRQYDTWEYQYKGAYRITVGEFTSLQEALDFRSRCKSAGYNQAFVAAFRGDQRETDPSVFKR